MNRSVLLFRVFHGLIAVFFLSCLSFLYYCAFTRQLSPLLLAAVAVLALEGLAVLLNKGNCPLAFIQQQLGDEKPFFDLFLPHSLARRAIPFFALVTVAGIVLLFLRTGVFGSLTLR